MLFDSIDYFLFLFLFVLIYYLVYNKLKWIVLLVSGMIFYWAGDSQSIYVPIIIIFVTYFAGISLAKTNTIKSKKFILIIGILTNVLLLVFYKYINFFVSSIVYLFDIFSKKQIVIQSSQTVFIRTIIPLGISFITFQAISYLVDIYDNKILPEKNFGYFATYIFYFPKVISGPVERAVNFIPQLYKIGNPNYEKIVDGLKRIVWGLFKKLVIANRLALYTDAVFSNYTHHSGFTLFIAPIFYTFQLYADFSGYTDIAIGSSKLFGIDLSENFNRPLLSLSITEFWRRWHITLTSWVTDYIFTPMVIKRRFWGKWGVVYSTVITFVILGLWHGANWTFVIFGLLHGVIVSVEFLTKRLRKKIEKKLPNFLNNFIGISYTILFFSFTQIFFNSNSLITAIGFLKLMILRTGYSFFVGSNADFIYSVFGIVFLVFYELDKEYDLINIKFFTNKKTIVQQLAYICLLIIILLIGVFDGGEFIYFKF